MPLIVQSKKPRVVLGLMNIGTLADRGARIFTQEGFKDVLDAYQARGYSEVDTARNYMGTQQEAFTREAGWKERGLNLATKVMYPMGEGANSAEKVIESVEQSLKELGTDYIDTLYLHNADRTVPFAETLEAMDRLHKAGKFGVFGLSNFAAHEVAEVVMTCKYNGWVRPTLYQGMYNCLTRNIEKELFVACRRYGLDIVVYNPICGGLLSGKVKSKDVVPETGRFSAHSAWMGGTYRNRYFRDATFDAVKVVEEAADKAGLTMIEIAFRWLVHHSGLKVLDGNDAILMGVSSVEQVGKNLDALEKGPLPEEVVKALEDAWTISRSNSVNYWHGDLVYTYDPKEALFGANAK
ncbi:Aflatoxin B1 aldehyde reductase member 2 [Escovopsis weberi]|uniref:Aflatoxin B1 aldehyde reductase member 2 n=1 Tax=Escovopsis weberi TaxID=150374 RepID=A0A0N0RU96_ESCWE|nr:Aflatoxin B1 aldehyde reductase member 2 [Escovopsis weberi]